MTGDVVQVSFWPLGGGNHVLEGHESTVVDIEFTLDGASLVSTSWDNTVRLWPSSPTPTCALCAITPEV